MWKSVSEETQHEVRDEAESSQSLELVEKERDQEDHAVRLRLRLNAAGKGPEDESVEENERLHAEDAVKQLADQLNTMIKHRALIEEAYQRDIAKWAKELEEERNMCKALDETVVQLENEKEEARKRLVQLQIFKATELDKKKRKVAETRAREHQLKQELDMVLNLVKDLTEENHQLKSRIANQAARAAQSVSDLRAFDMNASEILRVLERQHEQSEQLLHKAACDEDDFTKACFYDSEAVHRVLCSHTVLCGIRGSNFVSLGAEGMTVVEIGTRATKNKECGKFLGGVIEDTEGKNYRVLELRCTKLFKIGESLFGFAGCEEGVDDIHVKLRLQLKLDPLANARFIHEELKRIRTRMTTDMYTELVFVQWSYEESAFQVFHITKERMLKLPEKQATFAMGSGGEFAIQLLKSEKTAEAAEERIQGVIEETILNSPLCGGRVNVCSIMSPEKQTEVKSKKQK